MKSKAFWNDILSVIDDGFLPNGLQKLERYAEQFISGRLVYKRFSPSEQRGCSAGGFTYDAASIYTGASVRASGEVQEPLIFKEECERGKVSK